MKIEAPELSSLDRARHGFFTRRGGSSQGIYASLNCGTGSRDERTLVRENRGRVARSMAVEADRLLTPYQVHGITVAEVRAPWDWRNPPRADGVVSAVPGLAIGVSTADCAPVLFADAGAGVVGAAHAGWRGARAGICEATINAMEGLGATRSAITAVVGPCISGANYQVGPEFHAAFIEQDPGSEHYFRADRANDEEKFLFDLPGFVASRLKNAGVGQVGWVDRCTYAGEEDFFSYRRATHAGEPDYGRQLSVIVLL